RSLSDKQTVWRGIHIDLVSTKEAEANRIHLIAELVWRIALRQGSTERSRFFISEMGTGTQCDGGKLAQVKNRRQRSGLTRRKNGTARLHFQCVGRVCLQACSYDGLNGKTFEVGSRD